MKEISEALKARIKAREAVSVPAAVKGLPEKTQPKQVIQGLPEK